MSPHSIARNALACALGTILFAIHVDSRAAAPRYTVTVVGPLAPTQSFVGAAINARGQVAGTLTNAGELPVAAVWKPGKPVHAIGYLVGLGAQSKAAALNGDGMVVGTSGAPGHSHAFAWTHDDRMTDLGALLPDVRASSAMSVDDAGEVVLEENVIVGGALAGGHAWTWRADQGLAEIVPTFAGASVFAKGINQLGQVTGYSGTPTGWEAMIWTRATGMQTLGRPVGWYDGTSGVAINDAGEVVGDSTVGCCIGAVAWTSQGGWVSLGGLPNLFGYSAAFAVNNAGVIVGGTAKGGDSHDVAAIWFPGHPVADLSNFIDPADPLAGVVKLTSAVGINDAGQILANGTLDGRAQAVVLTPQK